MTLINSYDKPFGAEKANIILEQRERRQRIDVK